NPSRGHDQPGKRVGHCEHHRDRGKQPEDRRRLHPFRAEHNANYLFRKQSATDRDRNRRRYEQREASEERPGKALGIMLNPRKSREGYARDRSVQLLYRQSDELKRPPIQSERVGSPKTTEEEFFRVPREVYDEAVTGGQSPKVEH